MWGGKNRAWSWWFLSAVIAGVAAVLLLMRGLPIRLDTADQSASVISALLGAVSVRLAVVALQSARRPAQADPETLLGHACEELARQVRRQWEHEAGVRGLLRPEPLRVRWSLTARPVTGTREEVFGPGGGGNITRLSGDVAEVIRLWRQLPARQLAIIGVAGGGKTSLAVLLTLGLLKDRLDRRKVPVLLNLSGWAPKREHVDAWLARRLAELYPALTDQSRFGRDAATQLVIRAWVVPVLDGLDEIPPPLRTDAVAALTSVFGRDRPLVLTCRREEYQETIAAIGTPLARAAVVELDPLTGQQVGEYLPAGQINGARRWELVTAHLRAHPHGHLAQALSTPLMVYLARTAYTPPYTEPEALVRFIDQDAIEQHLLDTYLSVLYGSHTFLRAADTGPHTLRHSPEKTRQWLTFLARHTQQQDGSDLHWWRLVTAVPQPRLLINFTVGLIYALVVGPVGALTFGLVASLAAGSSARLSVGLMAGSMFGLVAGLRLAAGFVSFTHEAGGTYRLRTRPGNLAFGLVLGLAGGLVFGSVAGLVGGPTIGPVLGPAVGMGAGLLVGPAIGLVAQFEIIDGATRFSRTTAVPDVLHTHPGNLMLGLAYGLAGGLSVGFVAGPVAGIAAGLIAGPPIGLGMGLRFIDGSVVYVTRQNAEPSRLRIHPKSLASGMLYGLIAGLLAGLVVGPIAGLVVGTTIGLIGGLPFGLRPASGDELFDPRLTLYRDRSLFLISTLAHGLAFGLVGGLISGLVYEAGGGLPSALGIGLIGGLGSGLFGGYGGAWIRFSAARLWLGATGHLPWRLMDFLDDAYQRGLLRKVGAAYQFRHVRLRDYLAKDPSSSGQ